MKFIRGNRQKKIAVGSRTVQKENQNIFCNFKSEASLVRYGIHGSCCIRLLMHGWSVFECILSDADNFEFVIIVTWASVASYIVIYIYGHTHVTDPGVYKINTPCFPDIFRVKSR